MTEVKALGRLFRDDQDLRATIRGNSRADRVPILLCHLELHAQLLREVEKMREAMASLDAAGARRIVGAFLPGLVANPVATADTACASFLR